MQAQSPFLPVNTQWKQNFWFRLSQLLHEAKQTNKTNPNNHTALSSMHTAFLLWIGERRQWINHQTHLAEEVSLSQGNFVCGILLHAC